MGSLGEDDVSQRTRCTEPSGKRNRLVPFDQCKLEHRRALEEAASKGIGRLGGTEGVITYLREHYGIVAGPDIGFRGLYMAAEQTND